MMYGQGQPQYQAQYEPYQKKGLNSCGQCIKYLMFAMNFIFFVSILPTYMYAYVIHVSISYVIHVSISYVIDLVSVNEVCSALAESVTGFNIIVYTIHLKLFISVSLYKCLHNYDPCPIS